MMSINTSQKNEPPKPSIANFAPGTITSIPNEGQPQRKPSEKKTSILPQTNQNLNDNQSTEKSNPISIQPKVQKQPERTDSNPSRKQMTQPKKQAPVGTVPQNSRAEQASVIIVDTTLHFSLQNIISSILKVKCLDKSDLQKIQRNFKMYIKEKGEPLSLDPIQLTVSVKTPRGTEDVKIIKMSYLNAIEEKSKTLINLFWTQIIKSVCTKLPFLSVVGCFEITKLHIGMNKRVYCQKENEGTFNAKVFTDTKLYPIINNKMTIQKNHEFFKQVSSQIHSLTFGLFRSMKAVFRELCIMKNEPSKKEDFRKVFGDYERSAELKNSVMRNLLSSFDNMVIEVDEQAFENYIQYFEQVIESIWYFYQAETQVFTNEDCLKFIKFLDQNYVFFNSYRMSRSPLAKRFVQHVEQISLSFLFRHPFQFNNWPRNANQLIFNSNLQMFEPFKYFLEYAKRQELEDNKLNYPLRGIHWKQFIDNVIKLRYEEAESIDFIINGLQSFLLENANIFWEDPSQFGSFLKFGIKYNDQYTKKASPEQLRIILLNMIRIATSLMGQSLEEMRSKKEIVVDGDIEYPQSKKLPYAMKVHIEFSQYFMKINQREFLEIFCDQLKTVIIESIEPQNQQEIAFNGYNVLKPQDIFKKYALKLISSKPNILFELRKCIRDVKEEDLVNFLIIRTIKNPNSSTELLDLAFTALDALLVNQQFSHLIENILGLGQVQTDKPLNALAQRIFMNPKALTFLSRHCNILIDNGYQLGEWTKELLRIFYKNSQENQGSAMIKNHEFSISYSQLLSKIVGRLNLDDNQSFLQLRPYINVTFIIDSIKHHLKFDNHRNSYINVIVEKQKRQKIESLMHSIRLYNTVLLYCLKNKNSKNVQTSLQTGSLLRSKTSLRTNSHLISAFEARQLGIEDKQFHMQVKSLGDETTSYANALSFILISSTKQQKRTLKQINFDFETLIFQTIENLIKLNPGQDLTKFFSISKGTLSLIEAMSLMGGSGYEKSLLNSFVSYIDQSLNEVGIEIVIFGNLISEPQRLRGLIDKVRNKLQNPMIRQRIKPYLLLKLISTLSRYFRSSMLDMSLHKKQSFNQLQIQQHFEYLIQSIVEYIIPFKSTRKPQQAIIVDDTLANLYGGFLTVQNFSMKQFVKWIKNYHGLLLNDVNLKYFRNVANQQIPEKKQSTYTLGEEYFKLLNLFLNCDQYLQESEFKIIANIKNLPQTLSTFILNISHYSRLSVLPEELREILLQILTMSTNFYSLISTNPEQLTILFTAIIDSIKEQQLKPSTNLILLEIQLYNRLNIRYSAAEIDFTNMDQWPLQMNCIDMNVSTPIVSKIIGSLKKSTLNSTSFVSVCNGLMFLIQKSERLEERKTVLAKDLFSVYKHFADQKESINPRASLNRISISFPNQKSSVSNAEQSSPSYKKVWILELLLAILSSSQINETIEKVNTYYENVFVDDQIVLKRFGLLMRKFAYFEAQIYMQWLPHLNNSIQQEIIQGQSITFAEKLQLNQLLKMFNFILANQTWSPHFADGISDLIETFISYRKVFQKNLSSSKKPKAHTLQESILEGISLTTFAEKDEMMRSAINQLEKEKLQGNMLRSTNSFELMHEILNIELSTQYSMICVTIAQSQHLAMFKKNPLLSDASKWNIALTELAQTLTEKYVQMTKQEKILKTILNGFRESCYLANDNNLELSTEMLFTNSESLSCCLNVSLDLLTQIVVETLELLLGSVHGINKQMQKELHSDFKVMNDKFNKMIQNLKRYDRNNFNWATYEGSEKKAMLAQTIRSNITRTVTMNKSQSVMNMSHNKL